MTCKSMAQFGDTTVLSEPDPTVEKGKVGIRVIDDARRGSKKRQALVPSTP